MDKADTYYFSSFEQKAEGVRLPRGHRFAVVGKTGVYVMEHIEAGKYDLDILKLGTETEVAKSLPLAIIIIPAEHAYAWASVTPDRAVQLLDHMKEKALH